MSNDEMSRLLDEFGMSLFKLIRVRTRIATGSDYTGGEFVLTQQVPRAQSKIVKRNHTDDNNKESDLSGI